MIFTNTKDVLNYIRKYMLVNDIPIKTLAEKLQKSNSNVSEMLRQTNIKLNTLSDICNALDLHLEINFIPKDDTRQVG